MSASCQHEHDFTGASPEYRRALVWVIIINAAMFVVEMVFGISGQSQALQADALDFLGDSATYALSLWAIGKPLATRGTVALIKGVSLLFMALWVLGSTLYYVFYVSSPSAPIMGGIAVAALLANVVSVLLLMRFKDGDANVRSVWLCSRNDAVGNVAVLLAAGLVVLTGTRWPDLLVAAIMSLLFLSSSKQIITQALAEKHHAAH